MAVSLLDFLDGRDVVTVRFRLQKLPIIDRARIGFPSMTFPLYDSFYRIQF